jgi:hypothetical protein
MHQKTLILLFYIYHFTGSNFSYFVFQQAYNAIAVTRQIKLLTLASQSNKNNSASETSCEQKTTESKEVSASEYSKVILSIHIYIYI